MSPLARICTHAQAMQANTLFAELVRKKQKLIERIVKMRKEKGLSQTALAKQIGVSQSRIAQIESGVGTSKITFDILFHILNVLGFSFQIRILKTA